MHKPFEYNYIADGIYIGNNRCCQMHFDEMLKKEGITYDISLEKDRLDTPFGVESYVWIPVENHHAPSREQLDFGVSVIEKMVAMGKKVYIHCQNGHGRAPTLVAAYLIKKGLDPKMAVEAIRAKRPSIHPEDTQMKALGEFASHN